MIHLHTLGDARIVVGDREVRPTSPVLFAALLHLSVERGRRVPRAALQEMLFPESDERSGAHSLRQLLYKLRQLGAPIEADEASVSIAESCVHDPLADGDGAVPVDSLVAGFLPGYGRPGAEAFCRWLDTVRDRATIDITRRLGVHLERARGSGDVARAHRIATAVLELDPLNEAATLAKAESLALTGSKHEAMRVLEEYVSEVGITAPELRAPAQQLRRRISERVEPPDPTRSPLVGRAKELAWLMAQHRRAAAGRPTISVLWGDPGIGKTRLVQELLDHLRLGDARAVKAQCQPHDSTRPLGAISDFVPQLLQARGALGVSPESMTWLRRLDSTADDVGRVDANPAYVTAQLRAALIDLLTSIASEGPLVLLVEDTHWLDEASARFLLTVVPSVEARVHVVLTRRPVGSFFEGIQLTEDAFVLQLLPLDRQASDELLMHSLRRVKGVSDVMKEECLALAAGNPLFLRSIGEHLQLRGAVPSTDAGIAELLIQRVRILDPASLLMLRSAAVLGPLGTFHRISACAGQSPGAAMLAFQTLTDRGLLLRTGSGVQCCHDLLVEAVLADSPKAIQLLLHERAAVFLEQEGTTHRQTNLLWSCAEHWHNAEQNARAAEALRRCASLAMSVGQPLFAVGALERAQELCDHEHLVPLVEEALRVADAVADHQSALRNATRLRSLISSGDGSATSLADLVELNALRRRGVDIWAQRERIRQCALSPKVGLDDRRRAARVFILAAEEHFARQAALDFAKDAQALWSDAESVGALELRMYFEAMFGDIASGGDVARRLIAHTRSLDASSQPRLLSNAANVLFLSGAIEEGISVAHEAVELSSSFGVFDDMLQPIARLTDLYFSSGRQAEARRWLQRADRLFAANKVTAFYHLANRITMSLIDRDWTVAMADLETLQAESECSKPHAARSLFALRLLLAAARGRLHEVHLDLSVLEAIDDAGRFHDGHVGFAVALFLGLRSVGEHERALSRLDKYINTTRRERYAVLPAISALGLSSQDLSLVSQVCSRQKP